MEQEKAKIKELGRVKIEIRFEIERDKVPSKQELEAAWNGAVDALVKPGQMFYKGHMSATVARKRKTNG